MSEKPIFQKITAFSTIVEDIEIIEMVSEKAEDKLREFVRTSEREVTSWMLNENIKTWNELKEKAKNKKSEEIIKICIDYRDIHKSIEEYIYYNVTCLKSFYLSEKIIIEYLASTI